mmetsp:Transcript_2573/g.3764  ORF Transcript_2573/g.3764 Transcript_2573/m.3764 type:complete len:80 (+) Transcript_2573:677-916(+)
MISFNFRVPLEQFTELLCVATPYTNTHIPIFTSQMHSLQLLKVGLDKEKERLIYRGEFCFCTNALILFCPTIQTHSFVS